MNLVESRRVEGKNTTKLCFLKNGFLGFTSKTEKAITFFSVEKRCPTKFLTRICTFKIKFQNLFNLKVYRGQLRSVRKMYRCRIQLLKLWQNQIIHFKASIRSQNQKSRLIKN